MGCSPVVPGSGPMVTLVDSVVLADPDTVPRPLQGEPVVRSADGELFVEAIDRVLQFGPDGAFRRTIGRAGEGPGELDRATGMQLLPGDSLLAVVSTSRARMVVFRVADGSVARDAALGESFIAGQGWVVGDTSALIPAHLDRVPFRRWDRQHGTVTRWGEALPAMQAMSKPYTMGGVLGVAPLGDGALALVPGDSMLVRYDATGRITGRVRLPTVRRRAIPADLDERYRELLHQQPPRFEMLAPHVLGIHRLASGAYLIVHFDGKSTLYDQPLRLEFSNAQIWLSLLAPDLETACVDGRIPITSVYMPRPIFSGDTVSFLKRTLTDDGRPVATLRSFLVQDTGCDWLPTGGPITDIQ